jgi:hypothetical protein
MPIWLRKFTFLKLKEHYDKQNEEAEKQQNMMSNKSKQEVAKPNIAPQNKPHYTAKAPRK